MGAATVQLRSPGGAAGTAALPVRPDNAGRVGGSTQMQGGRGPAAAGGPDTALKVAYVTLTPSASYATGGDTVDWTPAGFDSIVAVIPQGLVSGIAANLSVMEYDHANSKLKVMKCGGSATAMAQATNASDQSACRFNATVYGT